MPLGVCVEGHSASTNVVTMTKRANRDVTVAGLLYPEGTELPDNHKAVRRVPDAFDNKAAPAKKTTAKKKAAAKSDT